MHETAKAGAYEETYGRWHRDPEGFWRELAADIEWVREPEVVLDDTRAPLYRWFAGGQLSTCFNMLDRHVRDGRADQPALATTAPSPIRCARTPTASCLIRRRGWPGH